jgi:catechol 2,3-dioxygenase-like lactoylglutathione lyase family enzyme
MRDLASPSGFAFAGLSPELLVTDLARSLEFWRGLCGFSIAYERAEERFAYLVRDGLQVMLEELGSPMRTWMKCDLERPFGRGVNFQFRIGDVDRVAAKFVAADWPLLPIASAIEKSECGNSPRPIRTAMSFDFRRTSKGRSLRPRSRIGVLSPPWRSRIRFERGGGGRRSRA